MEVDSGGADMSVVVIGGGWAGCAAALEARKCGAETMLLERTDALLGTGLVGGLFRNNGRFTASEELIAMGGGELFTIMDETVRHRDFSFPGHEHASVYDVNLIEKKVYDALHSAGVTIRFEHRVVDVELESGGISSVVTESGERIGGEAFVDATGTFGPQGNCAKYGNGCAMCVMRCPAFGPRVSIAGKAKVPEIAGEKENGSFGSMSGSCKIGKDSLSKEIVEELERTGVMVIPLPAEMINRGKLSLKCCQQYALPEFAENLILIDSGHVKLMSPYFHLPELRSIKGFENARFVDPYAGSRGNSMRFLAVTPRDSTLKADSIRNLFCAGEKAGLLVGHTEAVCSGVLAGFNAAGVGEGRKLLTLPETTLIGDFIDYSGEMTRDKSMRTKRCTFSGSVYFGRMKEKGFYTIDQSLIRKRVEDAGMNGIFDRR
jgi:hypothetical protein